MAITGGIHFSITYHSEVSIAFKTMPFYPTLHPYTKPFQNKNKNCYLERMCRKLTPEHG